MADSKDAPRPAVNPFTGKMLEGHMPQIRSSIAKELKKRPLAESEGSFPEHVADPSSEAPEKFIILAGGVTQTSRSKKSLAWAIVAVPDGRMCKACWQLDDSPDPVYPDQFRGWLYPPLPGKDGGPPRNQGKMCVYCGRLYDCRYVGVFSDTKSWVATLKAGSKERELFLQRLERLISFFVARGTRDIAYDEPDIEESVQSKDYDEEGWDEPTTAYWEWSEYVKDHGDPRTNGKGHLVTERWNKYEQIWETTVVVPARKIYTYKRRSMKQAAHIKVLDRGKLQLGANHMQERMQELSLTFGSGLPKATGVRLSTYLAGPLASSSSTRVPAPTPQASQISPTKKQGNGLDNQESDGPDGSGNGDCHMDSSDDEVNECKGAALNFGVRSASVMQVRYCFYLLICFQLLLFIRENLYSQNIRIIRIFSPSCIPLPDYSYTIPQTQKSKYSTVYQGFTWAP